jgi:hypothetical protein
MHLARDFFTNLTAPNCNRSLRKHRVTLQLYLGAISRGTEHPLQLSCQNVEPTNDHDLLAVWTNPVTSFKTCGYTPV